MCVGEAGAPECGHSTVRVSRGAKTHACSTFNVSPTSAGRHGRLGEEGVVSGLAWVGNWSLAVYAAHLEGCKTVIGSCAASHLNWCTSSLQPLIALQLHSVQPLIVLSLFFALSFPMLLPVLLPGFLLVSEIPELGTRVALSRKHHAGAEPCSLGWPRAPMTAWILESE